MLMDKAIVGLDKLFNIQDIVWTATGIAWGGITHIGVFRHSSSVDTLIKFRIPRKTPINMLNGDTFMIPVGAVEVNGGEERLHSMRLIGEKLGFLDYADGQHFD